MDHPSWRRLDSMNFGRCHRWRERRLNVCSPARHRCQVFVSLIPRYRYLTYDGGGAAGLSVSLLMRRQACWISRMYPCGLRQRLEEDLASVIRSLGYPVDAQVGSAGFRMTLPSVIPTTGTIHLAVECMGLRIIAHCGPASGTGCGRKVREVRLAIHRIWSTDWSIDESRNVIPQNRSGGSTSAPPPGRPPLLSTPRSRNPRAAVSRASLNGLCIVGEFAVRLSAEPLKFSDADG